MEKKRLEWFRRGKKYGARRESLLILCGFAV